MSSINAKANLPKMTITTPTRMTAKRPYVIYQSHFIVPIK